MAEQTRKVRPGPKPRTVIDESGQTLVVPAEWELLPPGDAALTRRVKSTGPSWTVQEKKGRRTFSRGVWADAIRIERIRAELATERSTESYAKRKAADARRREAKQSGYVQDFRKAVLSFLAFHPRHEAVAAQLSDAVTEHATPVGSGTVARTELIPIERRAEAAVIAWMRHQTTAYDSMKIARVKGKRRETRRMLAMHSRYILARYRDGQEVDSSCPLKAALSKEA